MAEANAGVTVFRCSFISGADIHLAFHDATKIIRHVESNSYEIFYGTEHRYTVLPGVHGGSHCRELHQRAEAQLEVIFFFVKYFNFVKFVCVCVLILL